MKGKETPQPNSQDKRKKFLQRKQLIQVRGLRVDNLMVEEEPKQKGLSRKEKIAAGAAGFLGILAITAIIAAASYREPIQTSCFENTPTTSAATGMPRPAETERSIEYTWRHLDKGESVRVGPNDYFDGDGSVNDVFYADSESDTALVINFQAEGILTATYAGDLRTACRPEEKQELVLKAAKEKLQEGFRQVFVKTYNGEGQNTETAVYELNNK